MCLLNCGFTHKPVIMSVSAAIDSDSVPIVIKGRHCPVLKVMFINAWI